MSTPTQQPAKPHRIAVLGPIPRDRIITYRSDVLEKYGCALYTAIALAALIGDEGVVLPIVNVAEDDHDAIVELLKTHDNIDVTGVRAVHDRGDVVELRYIDQNNRIERQKAFMAPITPADVEFALDADAFVCVPITDYEVSQSTLEYIRANSTGVILLDGHGPTSTLVRGGERAHRLWVDMGAWLPSIDILKMNLEEAGCSWLPALEEDREPGDPIPLSQLHDFAAYVLRKGVKALCVTLDESGCVAFTLDGAGEIVETTVPRVPITTVVDTTGCGDSFAAGMAFGYLLDRDIVTACRYGNAMGAQRASATVLDAYLPFEETSAQIEKAYAGAVAGGRD
ncbi:Carbohydrate kinase, PfkB family protein [Nostocoides japonicum T1-X7]|uniref:Carbohydrate kinase, PfkB family protein n=1 Tax=Nostocoides japonicum T1-X7 TaxID=1194083 RepID=A0A077M2V4_9MICO|nr:carbohydrate kinase family protein [Tetrasphaera japonica]CCH79427.1 Carbohydrate kinase, PfkB family protein [Tetrasphaera japonica T1-X7]